MKVYRRLFELKKMTLRYETLFFYVYHTVFINRYLGYMDRFNRKKDPIVIMGHLGVPTKKMVKGNECFIFYLCGLCSADYANYFVYVPCGSFGVLHAIR